MKLNTTALPLFVASMVAVANSIFAFVLPSYGQCLGVLPSGQPGPSGPGIEMALYPDPYSKSLIREARIMEKVFDLKNIRLSWVMEMNALSHPEHGVMMGSPMGQHFVLLSQQKQNPAVYGVGFGFVMAHEYAHQFQFKHFNVSSADLAKNSIKIELQADLLGAYWIGVRCRKQADEAGLTGSDRVSAERMCADAISESSFMVGEGWLAPKTHGTKAQRVSVSGRAFQAGLKGKFGDDLSKFKKNEDGYRWMEREVRDAMGEQ